MGCRWLRQGLAKKQGGLPEDYEIDVLDPFREAVAQQVARSLQFFFSSSDVNSVDAVILGGGVAATGGLAALVRERLDTEVFTADPFAGMSDGSRGELSGAQCRCHSDDDCCGLGPEEL